jgi:hypothetical protein
MAEEHLHFPYKPKLFWSLNLRESKPYQNTEDQWSSPIYVCDYQGRLWLLWICEDRYNRIEIKLCPFCGKKAAVVRPDLK